MILTAEVTSGIPYCGDKRKIMTASETDHTSPWLITTNKNEI
jgi:hypothetical protein